MAYKIKELREKRRLSQAELAEMSGVDVVVNSKTLEKIASALNVSIRTLFLP